MAKINLTPSRINDLRCDPGQAQTFLWDSAVPGLAVRATPSGKKSFIVQGRLGAKTIRFSIGDAAATTLDKARDAARAAWASARVPTRESGATEA